MEGKQPRRRRFARGWSPFARAEGSSCEAAAAALLLALEHQDCALDDLTPDRYSSVRRAHPELELPRAVVIRRVCGGWRKALEAADGRASALSRQGVTHDD